MNLSEYEQQFLDNRDAFYWKQKAEALDARVKMLETIIATAQRRATADEYGYEDACPNTLQLPGLAIPFSNYYDH